MNRRAREAGHLFDGARVQTLKVGCQPFAMLMPRNASARRRDGTMTRGLHWANLHRAHSCMSADHDSAKRLRVRADASALEDPALLRRLLRAKDRMDAASDEAWPIERLAAVSGVSAAYFARSFKRAFGVPPHRYLLTRRIEQATTLLRDTDLDITDIAFATGWASLGTFGRIFRDITGMSPGAMRIAARAATGELDRVPACVLKAAQRPALTSAVLEKRRAAGDAIVRPSSTREVS
jgi:AraC-like DNA-binding protein